MVKTSPRFYSNKKSSPQQCGTEKYKTSTIFCRLWWPSYSGSRSVTSFPPPNVATTLRPLFWYVGERALQPHSQIRFYVVGCAVKSGAESMRKKPVTNDREEPHPLVGAVEHLWSGADFVVVASGGCAAECHLESLVICHEWVPSEDQGLWWPGAGTK